MLAGRTACAVTALLTLCTCVPSASQRASDQQCQVVRPLKAVPDLREGSGLALSRQLPRRLFTINDSDAPQVLVLNLDGVPTGTVAVTGAAVVDWEDVTTGKCPDGTCLYVSDIGDNAGVRRTISIYRMLEPREGDKQAAAVRFDAVYPDGPHDAEAVFMGPGDRLYLLTKEPRGSALYAFPARLTPGMPNRLERIAALDLGTGRNRFARVTDAETSVDGRTVAIRTNDTLFLVPIAALLAGRMSDASVFSLLPLKEPQGEGVALGASGETLLVGEGGGRRATGTFARLTCVAAP